MGCKYFENNTARKRVERHANIFSMGKSKPHFGGWDDKRKSFVLQSSDVKENTNSWEAHEEDKLWGVEF